MLLAGELAGQPQGFLTIPGSDIGLLVVLDRTIDGEPLLALTGISAETQPNGGNIGFLRVLGLWANDRARHDGWLHGGLESRRRLHRHGHQEDPGAASSGSPTSA